MTTDTSNRDPKTEAALARLGATNFVYDPQVDLKKIDWDASAKNQTRIHEPLKASIVEQYVENLRNGDVFPALILWRRPDGSLYVLDGLHRANAYKSLDEAPDAYILPPETSVRVRMFVAIHFNARHGLALAKDDRIRHAMFVREAFKLTAGEAARQMGLKPSELQGAIDAENANQRWAECLADVENLDPRIWDSLKVTTRVALAKVKTDEAFIAAVQLAHDAGLSKSAADDLVKEMRPIRAVKAQLAVIDRWRKTMAAIIQENATAGSGRARAGAQPAHVRAALAVGAVRNLDPVKLAALPSRERAVVAESATEGIKRLTEVLDAIKAAEAAVAS